MVQKPSATTPPAALPLLSQGKHRNPARGACFMEYTSVLAGEPFTDSPPCVDDELAAVLRGASEKGRVPVHYPAARAGSVREGPPRACASHGAHGMSKAGANDVHTPAF